MTLQHPYPPHTYEQETQRARAEERRQRLAESLHRPGVCRACDDWHRANPPIFAQWNEQEAEPGD